MAFIIGGKQVSIKHIDGSKPLQEGSVQGVLVCGCPAVHSLVDSGPNPYEIDLELHKWGMMSVFRLDLNKEEAINLARHILQSYGVVEDVTSTLQPEAPSYVFKTNKEILREEAKLAEATSLLQGLKNPADMTYNQWNEERCTREAKVREVNNRKNMESMGNLTFRMGKFVPEALAEAKPLIQDLDLRLCKCLPNSKGGCSHDLAQSSWPL